MKKVLSLLLTLAMTAAMALSAPVNAAAEDLGDPVTFKFALTVASTHPYSISAQEFAAKLEELSGGNMTCELYYDGTLGGDSELLEAMQLNAVTFALMGPAGVQGVAPIYNFLDLPCLFETNQAAYEFWETDAAKSLLQNDALLASGLRGLGFYENGYYLISNNKEEITTMDQLKGLQLRSMTSDMAIKSWECLGVQPVSMPFGELFMALQNGTVDGQETTVGSFYSSQFYEVQKYLTQSNRIFHTMTFLMSNTAWEALTEAQQEVLMQAFEASSDFHKEQMLTYNQEKIDEMVNEHGVVYTPALADGEFEKMKEMSASIYDMIKESIPDDYDALMEAAQAANAAHPAE